MNVTNEHDDAAHRAPRIRVIPVKELLDQANNAFELRRWIYERAERGLCHVYWPLPRLMWAFSGLGIEWPLILRTRPETRPDMWDAQPEVRFVRLAPQVAGQFRDHGRLDVSRFPDGLFVPPDVSADSGILEVITFSARLRVAHPSQPVPPVETNYTDQDPRDGVTIMYDELYVEDSVRDDVRDHFDDSPRTEPNPFEIACGIKPTSRPGATKPAIAADEPTRAALAPVATTAASEDVHDDDPYHLKGRSNGVYVLYRTAERCASNTAFARESKPGERKKMAHAAFDKLLDEMANGSGDERARQKGLRQLYRATRLDYALRLIDPEFDHKLGRPKEQQHDWPTTKGKTFLALPDARRQAFVTDMLRLIIGGAEHWLSIDATSPANGEPKKDALRQWLEDHGLTGADELKTAFAVITWNGQTFQTPPKSATPSPSRDRVAGARRASRRWT